MPRTDEAVSHLLTLFAEEPVEVDASRFTLFYTQRQPAEMDEAEIGRFLSSLATDFRVSASTQNQALNALLVPVS